MTTGFFHDGRCLWHGGGRDVRMPPVGLVQPIAGGRGLPEDPETKRRSWT